MTADESSKSPKPTLDSNGVSASTVTAGSPPASGGAAAGSPAPSSDEKPSPQLQELIARGLDLRLATRLEKLFASTNLVAKDLDDRAVEALKEFGNVDGAISVLDEFEESNLQHVANKSAFLCGLMKTHRQKEKASKQQKQHELGLPISGAGSPGGYSQKADAAPNGAAHPGPDEAKLKAILDRTGYSLDVTSGQRKYGGPPPDWEGSAPGPGCEVFIGKIPKEIYEDELVPLFEDIGRIWDLRLMIDPLTGHNRGYGFVTFCNKEDAFKAQEQFEGHEIRKGKPLKVNISVPNLRLFVGNIPKSKSKEEIFSEFSKLTEGLNEVIVYSSPDDRKRNRGFCFLEFESHKAASLAKRKLSTGRTKVWSCDILVDWADPQEEPDQETMSKVKVLYARNLVADVTEEELRDLFAKHGNVERVKKIKDYAFVHFDDRDAAVNAMRALDAFDLRGVKMNVSLAKPPSDRKKKEEVLRNRERRVTVMMQTRTTVPGGMGMGRNSLVPPMGMPLPPPMMMAGPGRGGRRGTHAGPSQYGRQAPGYEPDYGYEYGGYEEYDVGEEAEEDYDPGWAGQAPPPPAPGGDDYYSQSYQFPAEPFHPPPPPLGFRGRGGMGPRPPFRPPMFPGARGGPRGTTFMPGRPPGMGPRPGPPMGIHRAPMGPRGMHGPRMAPHGVVRPPRPPMGMGPRHLGHGGFGNPGMGPRAPPPPPQGWLPRPPPGMGPRPPRSSGVGLGHRMPGMALKRPPPPPRPALGPPPPKRRPPPNHMPLGFGGSGVDLDLDIAGGGDHHHGETLGAFGHGDHPVPDHHPQQQQFYSDDFEMW